MIFVSLFKRNQPSHAESIGQIETIEFFQKVLSESKNLFPKWGSVDQLRLLRGAITCVLNDANRIIVSDKAGKQRILNSDSSGCSTFRTMNPRSRWQHVSGFHHTRSLWKPLDGSVSRARSKDLFVS